MAPVLGALDEMTSKVPSKSLCTFASRIRKQNGAINVKGFSVTKLGPAGLWL